MFQQTIVVGHVGGEPEEKFTADGKLLAFFSVATSKRSKGLAGENVDKTTWFRITTSGTLAEAMVKYLKKGSKVLVVGELNSDTDTGGPKVYQKKDGSWGASYELYAQTVRFLSDKEEQREVGW